MNNGTKTLWSDTMILEAVRDAHGLTAQALDRAFELADAGLIDMTGTWKLTAAGKACVGAPMCGAELLEASVDLSNGDLVAAILVSLRANYITRELAVSIGVACSVRVPA
jgi:hypothetical protein